MKKGGHGGTGQPEETTHDIQSIEQSDKSLKAESGNDRAVHL